MMLLLLNRNGWYVNYKNIIYLIFIFVMLSISLFIEHFAGIQNYEPVLKIFINFGMLLLISFQYRCVLYGENTRVTLRLILSAYLLLQLAVFYYSGISVEYDQIVNTGIAPDSSMLYAIAEPLSNIFVTKNILAMYLISLFAFFLYLSHIRNDSVKMVDYMLFLIPVLLCFSRQAMLSYLVLFSFHVFMKMKNRYLTFMLLMLSMLAGGLFFNNFFNLNSPNDGASQRVELWLYFFENLGDYFWAGLGLSKMRLLLENQIGVDNFHMFFMNQIGAYGFVFFIFFSCVTCASFFWTGFSVANFYLFIAYYLNVSFQTFGWEFGGVYLMALSVNQRWILKNE